MPLLRLILHVQSDVELCLTSGRIDIRELLTSKFIRFWAVVISDEKQEPVRRALHFSVDKKLKEVLSVVGVPTDSDRWSASICPSPRKEQLERPVRDLQNQNLVCDLQDRNLVEAGIVFGSVLILEYSDRVPGRARRATAAGGQH